VAQHNQGRARATREAGGQWRSCMSSASDPRVRPCGGGCHQACPAEAKLALASEAALGVMRLIAFFGIVACH